MSRRRRLLQPIIRFIEAEVSGGIVLLSATIIALIWSNSAWASAYFDLWKVNLGPLSLSHWVNDGLMAVFFFVVGLEIKRELVTGELAGFKKAALPISAALGGMIVPAAIYVMFNAGTPTSGGWGIPMATDIAFALGVLSLGGKRVPVALKIFLMALAIVDDLGAVLVIAFFYSGPIKFEMLLYGGLILAALIAYGRSAKVSGWPYLLLGIPLWALFLSSGVHATIAGVLLALAVPVRTGLLENLEHRLHPWNTFLIVPIFALANAGVAIGSGLAEALRQPEAMGIVMGLVVGKPLGIVLFTWLCVKIAKSELPDNVNWRHVAAAGLLGGIGFTMSLFVTELAFEEGGAISTAKVAILTASLTSAILGLAVLRLRLRRRRRSAS